MKEVMLWNKDHTAAVRASKLREIVIYRDRRTAYSDVPHTEVKGWYNANEDFDFGWFKDIEEAEAFVKALNQQIEGGK